MRRFSLQTICFGIAAMVFAAIGRGQSSTTFQSIEWQAAAAEIVAEATVEEVGFADSGMMWAPRRLWTLTLASRNVMKGKAGARVTASYESTPDDPTWNNLKAKKQPVVWFLHPQPAPERAVGPEAGAPPVAQAEWVIKHWLVPPDAGKKLDPPLLAMDFSVMNDFADVMAAIKAEVALDGGKRVTQSARFNLPISIVKATGSNSVLNTFEVPVNPRLETLARQWIKAPETVVKPVGDEKERDWQRGERLRLREDATKALVFFKNDQNRELLKSLLKDDALRNEISPEGKPFVVYPVRLAAYDVLTYWGEKVEKPLISVPVPETVGYPPA